MAAVRSSEQAAYEQSLVGELPGDFFTGWPLDPCGKTAFDLNAVTGAKSGRAA